METKQKKTKKDAQPHVHCMFYCPDGWQGTAMQAKAGSEGERFPVILMAMRFDGRLGFFGGLCDGDGELDALEREVSEELGWRGFDRTRAQKVLPSFYVHPLTRAELAAIEEGVTRAPDFPSETLGLVRVPPVGGWYDSRADRRPGFSLRGFLCNAFIANSRAQLLHVVEAMGWLSPETIRYATDTAAVDHSY